MLDPSQEPVDDPAEKTGPFCACLVVYSSSLFCRPGHFGGWMCGERGATDVSGQSHTWEAARSITAGWSWLCLRPNAPLVHPFPAEICSSKLPATGISTGKTEVLHCPPYKFFLSPRVWSETVLDPVDQSPVARGGWILRYMAKSAWNSSSNLQKYLCCHLVQKKKSILPGKSDPKSLKAMIIGVHVLQRLRAEDKFVSYS